MGQCDGVNMQACRLVMVHMCNSVGVVETKCGCTDKQITLSRGER